MQRELVPAERGQRRTDGVDGHRDPPEQIPDVTGGGDRDGPEHTAQPDHDQVDVDGRPGVRQVPPGAEVEPEHDQPAGQVAERERDRLRADRVGSAGRTAGDRAGGQQFGQPEDQVVGVEPVGVQREADPGEPDRDEQAGELGQPGPAEVVDEGDGQLHDHQDVRQVEEQLQPAGRALPPQVQPGRPDHRDRSGLAFLGLHAPVRTAAYAASRSSTTASSSGQVGRLPQAGLPPAGPAPPGRRPAGAAPGRPPAASPGRPARPPHRPVPRCRPTRVLISGSPASSASWATRARASQVEVSRARSAACQQRGQRRRDGRAA